ncbi:MAG: type II secretion system F family protein [Pseudomonadota bacterium]
MPRFAYKSRSAEGTLIEGVIESASAGAVADELFARALTPTDIRETTANAPDASGRSRKYSLRSLLEQPISSLDTLLFSRQIHTLLKAGVPIMRALTGLQEASATPAMRQILQEVRAHLEAGNQLSAGLGRHPRVFSPFYVAMVKVGESTGRLDEVFIRLFKHLEFERYMQEQIKMALRYPSFVMSAMLAAFIVVNLFVIPSFAKIFAGFGAELPVVTRALLWVSNSVVAYWPYLLILLAGAFSGFRLWLGTTKGRYRVERLALRLPIVGNVLYKIALARFSRSFALAMNSGVPVIQALDNAVATIDNSYIAEQIGSMREGIERGDSIQRAARSVGIFTPVVLQMIAVGEESGAIGELMDEVGQLYQQEVEYELKTLSQQIEPILIVALGVLVLILALGVFLPMWDLGKAAFKH